MGVKPIKQLSLIVDREVAPMGSENLFCFAKMCECVILFTSLCSRCPLTQSWTAPWLLGFHVKSRATGFSP